ncbi:MAG: hypothetical protein WA948_09630 [Pontixanthobacter sp.]
MTVKQHFKPYAIKAKQWWSTLPWLLKGIAVCSSLALLISYFAAAFYGYFIVTMPLLFLVTPVALAYFLGALIIKFPALYVAVLLSTPRSKTELYALYAACTVTFEDPTYATQLSLALIVALMLILVAYALLILRCLNSPHLFDRVVAYVLCICAAAWLFIMCFPGDVAFAMEPSAPDLPKPEGHSTSTFSQGVTDFVTWLNDNKPQGSIAPVPGINQVLTQSSNVHNESAEYTRELNQSLQNLLVSESSSNMDELRDRVAEINHAASGVNIHENPDIAFAQGRSYEASCSTDTLRALQLEQADTISRIHVTPTSGYVATASQAFGQGLGTAAAEELRAYAGRVSTDRAAQQLGQAAREAVVSVQPTVPVNPDEAQSPTSAQGLDPNNPFSGS